MSNAIFFLTLYIYFKIKNERKSLSEISKMTIAHHKTVKFMKRVISVG